jgi:hypothetical protein
MAASTMTFRPTTSGIRALLDQLYDIKFSKHVPLLVVMLSMIYTIYRTHHYLSSKFGLDGVVSWPTATFIELLVLGASAAAFIALRAAFVAELKSEDVKLSWLGVHLSFVALALAFIALLALAGADAYALTHDWLSAGIMTLIQAAQMIFVCGFIVNATLDERGKLRSEYADYTDTERLERENLERERRQLQARQCPYCNRDLDPKNRARHIASCPLKP